MIKKLLLVSCLAFGITVSSYAQNKFTPGVRGGLSLSTITNAEADFKPGFYLGLQFPIKFAKFYTLQPELNYTMQGGKNVNLSYIRNDERSIDQEPKLENLNLSYIDLNVINKFSFNQFNVHIGPGLAIMTQGRNKTDFYGDLTLNFGIGYQITEQLGVEARFRQGFVRVIDKYDFYNWDNYWDNSDSFNSSFQIGLNYTF